jgi:hypothetical protein
MIIWIDKETLYLIEFSNNTAQIYTLAKWATQTL